MTSPTARLDILRTITSTNRNEPRTDGDAVCPGGTLERLCTGRVETEGHDTEGPSPTLPSNVVGDSRARVENSSVELEPFSLTLLLLLMLQPALLLPLARRWRGRQRMACGSVALSGACLARAYNVQLRPVLRYIVLVEVSREFQ